ncbi:MAG TPA: EVE domain-containing protein [Ktedonobacteraceae bacterium]|nr:EVE domain-containing protein [Ktedonobacteraceae bacterium]
MAYFLAKTDPETYSIDQFEREQRTVWDGVRNAQAVIVIKSMQPDDEVLIYHSQGETAIVGLAKVISEPRQDAHDPKSWVVEMEFQRRLAHAVSLREIKATHLFDDWSLIRQSRLSTMSVPEAFIHWLQEQHAL